MVPNVHCVYAFWSFRNHLFMKGLTMDKVIMSGCDLHEKNLLVKAAVGKREPQMRTFGNTRAGRKLMREWLRGLASEAGAYPPRSIVRRVSRDGLRSINLFMK